jgi:hypothetical protein
MASNDNLNDLDNIKEIDQGNPLDNWSIFAGSPAPTDPIGVGGISSDNLSSGMGGRC